MAGGVAVSSAVACRANPSAIVRAASPRSLRRTGESFYAMFVQVTAKLFAIKARAINKSEKHQRYSLPRFVVIVRPYKPFPFFDWWFSGNCVAEPGWSQSFWEAITAADRARARATGVTGSGRYSWHKVNEHAGHYDRG